MLREIAADVALGTAAAAVFALAWAATFLVAPVTAWGLS